MNPPRWVLAGWPDLAQVEELTGELKLPPELAAVFIRRGLASPEDLDPPLKPPPLPGLQQAAARIIKAIESGERIRVHGDYDADGVTAAALLTLGLAELGANVHAFIPHRLKDGYGLSLERVPEHIEASDLLITVDCGISNQRELSLVNEAGVSIIVTDHHAAGSQPPPGVVVHPAYSDALAGQPWPTGSGVAFFVLWAVRQALGKSPPLDYADLAAIGTVADVVPLLGVNRALVKEGLVRMPQSRHLGLRILAERHCQRCTAHEVAFRIAPRINAAGRLGEAETALEMLTTSDYARAQELADRLDELNQTRQRIEEEMLERVLPTLDENDPALVIHDPEGHPGVMGIVASRVLERYYKPVFIIAKGKGSVRSVPGVSAVAALAAAADHLRGYGGHEGAAGFSIDEGAIDSFRHSIHRYVAEQKVPPPAVVLDAELDSEDLPSYYLAQRLLEPFGQGNPEPIYYLAGNPSNIRPLSGGKHVAFSIGGVRVVKWRDAGEGLDEGSVIDLAASLVESEWQGMSSLELQALAYRPAGVIECDQEDFRVLATEPREAIERARRDSLPVYATGEGEAYLRQRGLHLVNAQKAAIWFAIPPQPVRNDGVELAISNVTFSRLLQPQSLTGLRKLLESGRPEEGLQAILWEQLQDIDEENYFSLPAYRRWRMALAVLRRLRLAYERGTPGCLGSALRLWWQVQTLLRKVE
ncbi:single-stranded-DNA-specific exonuclease RecJ [Oceanithermus sp.]